MINALTIILLSLTQPSGSWNGGLDFAGMMRAGSWVNVGGPAGLSAEFVWEGSGLVRITDKQNRPNLLVVVKIQTFDGTITLSPASNIIFLDGDGIKDADMEFYGRISDINKAMLNITYYPDDNTKTGWLDIDTDYYTTYINQAPVIHIPEKLND